MPQFAANLTLLYNELPVLARFQAAAEDGFTAVEYLFPYAFSTQALQQALQKNGLQQVLFNAPAGDWEAGERGLACLPGRETEFRAGFELALDYAQALNCPRIHVMAGIQPATLPPGWTPAQLLATYSANLRWAAEKALPLNKDVLIEPINQRDMPGYFLSRQAEAHALVQGLQMPNLKVQMDLYHCQIMEGDLETQLRRYLPGGRVGHLQIAGVPLRHEPDVGEVNYRHLFQVIDELSANSGWRGWVGCEYRPQRGAVPNATRDGLGWMHESHRLAKGLEP